MHTATFTVETNVIDGWITVNDPASPDRDLTAEGTPASFRVVPWGEDELGMQRADRAIEGTWTRVTEWIDETGSGQYLTAQVQEIAR